MLNGVEKDGIELAPGHKWGLQVRNPVILGVGTIGCGEAVPHGLALARMGAVVAGPILQASRAGSPPPRVAETNGGIVMQTGLQNRGIRAVLQRYAPLWSRLGCPVIAHVADSRPAAIRAIVEQLAEVDGLAGLELALPRNADARVTVALVGEAAAAADLPVCVKLPLERVAELARAAVEAGAVCMVVGQPPLGALKRSAEVGVPGIHARAPAGNDSVITVHGDVYGPLAFVVMLRALEAVARLSLPCGLVACGGIHTWEQVEQALLTGALAVQVDSAVWVEPGLPGWLVAEWEARNSARTAPSVGPAAGR